MSVFQTIADDEAIGLELGAKVRRTLGNARDGLCALLW